MIGMYDYELYACESVWLDVYRPHPAPTLFLSLPEWQHHYHNIRITTSTGGQRLFLDVCMWVCDVHSGTVTSVIMLFRHSYIVGE